jgi:acetyl esterase/lipase
VAVPNYRTYPDGLVSDQVQDCELAAKALAEKFGITSSSVTLMGHSSGAHVALLLLVDRAKRRMRAVHDRLEQNKEGGVNQEIDVGTVKTLEFDSFVGLSGPYDISHHFDYEAARGVEELSPLKPVNGYSRDAFRNNSPALRLQESLWSCGECQQRSFDNFLPPLALLHGIEDETVPFTATAEAARVLRSCGVTRCQEIYVPETGHQEVAMQIMLGGRSRDAVLHWLLNNLSSSDRKAEPKQILASRSKL